MKFNETTYGNPHKTITKFADHYVNLSVTMSDAGVAANADGKKIVPAGTILGGGFLASESVQAVKATSTGDPAVSNAEGVLFHDVDVTNGPAPGAVLIHGFVSIDQLPNVPTAPEIAALNMIKFIK